MRVWKCTCGEEFPEPGDWSGFAATRVHMNHNPGHRIVGMIDTETGELLVRGLAHQKAQDLGFLTPKGRGGRKPTRTYGPGIEAISPGKLVIKPIVAEISPEMLSFYHIARVAFPGYSEATVTEWLEDCVVGFYLTYWRSLGLDKLIKRFLPPEVAARLEGVMGDAERAAALRAGQSVSGARRYRPARPIRAGVEGRDNGGPGDPDGSGSPGKDEE